MFLCYSEGDAMQIGAEQTVAKQSQAAPLSLRVEDDLSKELTQLAKELKLSKHSIAVACLRLGLRDVRGNREEIATALRLETEAKIKSLAIKPREQK
jgi:hypothetical protein